MFLEADIFSADALSPALSPAALLSVSHWRIHHRLRREHPGYVLQITVADRVDVCQNLAKIGQEEQNLAG